MSIDAVKRRNRQFASSLDRELSAGTKVGPYLIVKKVGGGTTGDVYQAVDSQLDRSVALKILSDELAEQSGAIDRFAAEAKALARVRHPNIVGVHAVGCFDGLHCLVMEFIEGGTLADVISQGPLELQLALQIFEELVTGINAAHSSGIIHGDIKPSNVIIDEQSHVRIVDFGLARFSASSALFSDLVGGTPAYIAPELLLESVPTPASDVFSLGAVLFEMLTGEPFRAAPNSKRLQPLPPKLSGLVTKLCARDPAERPQSAEEVLAVFSGLKPNESNGQIDLKTARANITKMSFSSSEVEEILQMAIQLDTGGGFLGKATLIDIGKEVEISPEAVKAALRQYHVNQHAPTSVIQSNVGPIVQKYTKSGGNRAHVWTIFGIATVIIILGALGQNYLSRFNVYPTATIGIPEKIEPKKRVDILKVSEGLADRVARLNPIDISKTAPAERAAKMRIAGIDSKPKIPILDACQRGDLQEVRKILQSDPHQIEVKGDFQRTPMEYAVYGNFENVVAELLNHGASLPANGGFAGEPAVNIAAWNGNISMMKLLLSHGGTINSRGERKNTPLHYASRNGHFEMVKYLVENGGQVDAMNDWNTNALYEAAAEGYLNIVNYLLAKGATPVTKNFYSGTTLEIAARNGHRDVVDAILKSAIPVEPGKNESDAINERRLVAEKVVLMAEAETNIYPAVLAGDLEKVKLYLKIKPDLIKTQQSGKTALMVGIQSGILPMIELLIENGADVNASHTDNGSLETTPLIFAVKNSTLQVVEWLLKHGASVNQTSEMPKSAPLLAAIERGDAKLVTLLLDNGANKDITNWTGDGALHIAAQSGKADLVEIFLNRGVDVNVLGRQNMTALHNASSTGHVDVVRLLLKHGANPNLRTSWGKTALELAQEKKMPEVVALLSK